MTTNQPVVDPAAGDAQPENPSVPSHGSPFLRLPLEIRLSIYEEALLVDRPLCPRQVAPRANKFVWGLYFGVIILKSAEPPLTVTQLTRTCRQVHEELEAHPVFYRANRFEFHESNQLFLFLAAITPRRRAMIRYIALKPQMFGGGGCTSFYIDLAPQRASHRDLLALLSQLTDLRCLALELNASCPRLIANLGVAAWEAQYAADLGDFFLNFLLFDVGNPWALWKLSQFQLSLYFIDGVKVRFADEAHVSGIQVGSIVHRPSVLSMIVKIHRGLHLTRFFAREAEQLGQGLASKVTDIMLRDALRASGLDFVGEDRLSLDLVQSSIAPISSRTRKRTQANKNPSEMGTVERLRDKYDAEGLLVRPIAEIKDIRREGDTIQCEVVFKEHAVENSWERVEVLLTEEGLRALRLYYKDRFSKMPRNPVKVLDEMKDFPTPDNVRALSDPFLTIAYGPTA